MAKRSIYSVPSLMLKIEVMEIEDEDIYSEIPDWDGQIEQWTDLAVLIGKEWFPISQLRKTEDDDAIYASLWILDRKGY